MSPRGRRPKEAVLPEPTPEELFGRVSDINWRDKAACLGMPVELFVHTSTRYVGRKAVEAVAVCDSCPVQDDCLTEALLIDERDGIWGGKTPQQRRTIAGKAKARWMERQEPQSA